MAAIAANPMLEEAESEPKLFQVGFHDTPPPDAALDDVDRKALAPERVELRDGTFYLWFAGA